MHDIDAVLERFEAKRPEFGPGLSNHGPMAAEALIALGRGDVIEPWAEWYASRLDDPPESRNPIAPDAWREALGAVRRAGDWIAFFERELVAAPWAATLDLWVARLAPGLMAGATHGILRTAHAVRSLDRGETPMRLRELAHGLAYWAARYQELPSSPARATATRVPQALARVERLDPDVLRGRMIFDAVRALDPASFGPAIAYADVSVDAGAFVGDLTRTFVRQYMANASHAAIAFVHTVTAPSALRTLAPHLSRPTTQLAMRYAWQACASIYATFGRTEAAAVAEPDAASALVPSDLTDRAVAARDEHAIKFTEACLKEHALTGDAAFLLAAADAVKRLRARD